MVRSAPVRCVDIVVLQRKSSPVRHPELDPGPGCDAGRQRGRLIMSLLRTLLALEYVGHEDDLTMRVA